MDYLIDNRDKENLEDTSKVYTKLFSHFKKKKKEKKKTKNTNTGMSYNELSKIDPEKIISDTTQENGFDIDINYSIYKFISGDINKFYQMEKIFDRNSLLVLLIYINLKHLQNKNRLHIDTRLLIIKLIMEKPYVLNLKRITIYACGKLFSLDPFFLIKSMITIRSKLVEYYIMNKTINITIMNDCDIESFIKLLFTNYNPSLKLISYIADIMFDFDIDTAKLFIENVLNKSDQWIVSHLWKTHNDFREEATDLIIKDSIVVNNNVLEIFLHNILSNINDNNKMRILRFLIKNEMLNYDIIKKKIFDFNSLPCYIDGKNIFLHMMSYLKTLEIINIITDFPKFWKEFNNAGTSDSLTAVTLDCHILRNKPGALAYIIMNRNLYDMANLVIYDEDTKDTKDKEIIKTSIIISLVTSMNPDLVSLMFRKKWFQKYHEDIFLPNGINIVYHIATTYLNLFVENVDQFSENALRKKYSTKNYTYRAYTQNIKNQSIETCFAKHPTLLENYIKKITELGYDIFNVKIEEIIRSWLIGKKYSESKMIIAAKKADKSKSKGKCPICMEEHGRIVMSCGHSCCIECLVELPNRQCSICSKIPTTACLLY